MLRDAARRVGHGKRLPCSVLVAKVLLELVEDPDAYPFGGDWWQAINVWDPAWPWSMIDAVQTMEPHRARARGGFEQFQNGMIAHHDADPPTPNDWFVVQGWRRMPGEENASGHQLFLRWLEPMGAVEVIHSSESKGLRIETHPTASDILGSYQAGVVGAPLWPILNAPKEAKMSTRNRLKIPEEPIFTTEERDAVLYLVEEQIGKTIDQVKAGERVDGADLAEAALDLGLLLASAAIGGPAGAIIALVGPSAKDLVVNAVEAAEARNRTAERLRERAEKADASADEHILAAEKLQNTEKREFLERVRINIHLRRARALQAKADRLDAEAAVLEQQA